MKKFLQGVFYRYINRGLTITRVLLEATVGHFLHLKLVTGICGIKPAMRGVNQ